MNGVIVMITKGTDGTRFTRMTAVSERPRPMLYITVASGMTEVIGVTLAVAVAVIILSVLIGVPAAYLLARRKFPFKKLVTVLFFLPILMPPITYGIPLATVMYNMGLGRSLTAVILVNLVPSVPFVIMTMTPFIEQINPAIESAARMSGANTRRVFAPDIRAALSIAGLICSMNGVIVMITKGTDGTRFAAARCRHGPVDRHHQGVRTG